MPTVGFEHKKAFQFGPHDIGGISPRLQVRRRRIGADRHAGYPGNSLTTHGDHEQQQLTDVGPHLLSYLTPKSEHVNRRQHGDERAEAHEERCDSKADGETRQRHSSDRSMVCSPHATPHVHALTLASHLPYPTTRSIVRLDADCTLRVAETVGRYGETRPAASEIVTIDTLS